MKVSIPIRAACTLSDLKVWCEETKPEIIGIPKDHPLTAIWEFNPWHWEGIEDNPVWHTFRGIPILYGQEGEVEYKGIPIVREEEK